MIVRIQIKREDTSQTLLFGNSYKDWTEQFAEYCSMRRKDGIHLWNVEAAKDKWIGYGGLKWCSESSFQECLDEEAEGLNKPVRSYVQMKFELNSKVSKEANKIFER